MSPSKKRRKRICSKPPRKGTLRYRQMFGGYNMLRRSLNKGFLGNLGLDKMGTLNLMSLIPILMRKNRRGNR